MLTVLVLLGAQYSAEQYNSRISSNEEARALANCSVCERWKEKDVGSRIGCPVESTD